MPYSLQTEVREIFSFVPLQREIKEFWLTSSDTNSEEAIDPEPRDLRLSSTLPSLISDRLWALPWSPQAADAVHIFLLQAPGFLVSPAFCSTRNDELFSAE